jgi:transcriptional regulator GlxA family with amidase domain
MRIGLLVYKGCVTSGLFAFAEFLQVANKRAGQSKFDIIWCGLDHQTVDITAGSRAPVATLKVQASLKDSDLDVLLVPGFWTSHPRDIEK